MKFSVLIPTKNRLELLRLAVESVRNQDYDNWELIIADNCSEQDVRGYVESLGEPRIVYLRAAEPIPVTENWNRAIRPSAGEYVVMLGDDDALLSGYFSVMKAIVQRYERPELVYSDALLYACPGVIPDHPAGFVRTSGSALFDTRLPYTLGPQQARALVEESLNFRAPFAYNSQFSLVSRVLIERMSARGDFYQSPYPDTYSTNATLLESRRTLIVPTPMAIVGITPKSYGYYHVNQREQEGMTFLHSGTISPDAPELGGAGLPGSQFFLCWLTAVKQLEANYGRDFDLRVNAARYRYLCMGTIAKQHYLEGRHDRRLMADFVSRLTAGERWTLFRPMAALFSLVRLMPASARHRLMLRLFARALGTRSGLEPDLPSTIRNILDVQKAFPIQTSNLGISGDAGCNANQE